MLLDKYLLLVVVVVFAASANAFQIAANADHNALSRPNAARMLGTNQRTTQEDKPSLHSLKEIEDTNANGEERAGFFSSFNFNPLSMFGGAARNNGASKLARSQVQQIELKQLNDFSNRFKTNQRFREDMLREWIKKGHDHEKMEEYLNFVSQGSGTTYKRWSKDIQKIGEADGGLPSELTFMVEQSKNTGLVNLLNSARKNNDLKTKLSGLLEEPAKKILESERKNFVKQLRKDNNFRSQQYEDWFTTGYKSDTIGFVLNAEKNKATENGIVNDYARQIALWEQEGKKLGQHTPRF